MALRNHLTAALVAASLLAACSGGGGGGGGYNPPGPTATPTNNPNAQIVALALPQSAIGQVTDPTFGLVGGYTQQVYSQVLGFVPGKMVMIHNAQTSTPHTLGDSGGSGSFPAGQPAMLSTTGTGSSTLSSGWQSGTISPGASVGPITLNAGTYWLGCAYHYSSNTMRTVLVVAASATPGPQATQNPAGPTPQPTGGGGGGGGGGYGY
jgi:hypothetical protein